jgi:DNA repair and recombination RAD54-like protein
MNCIRCQNYNDMPESIEEEDGNQSTNISSQSAQETSDIGGFAEISGCLHKLKSSEKQVVHIYSVDITASNFVLGV